jgi:hypothetical protein
MYKPGGKDVTEEPTPDNPVVAEPKSAELLPVPGKKPGVGWRMQRVMQKALVPDQPLYDLEVISLDDKDTQTSVVSCTEIPLGEVMLQVSSMNKILKELQEGFELSILIRRSVR